MIDHETSQGIHGFGSERHETDSFQLSTLAFTRAFFFHPLHFTTLLKPSMN